MLTKKDSVPGKVCPVSDVQKMLGNVGFPKDVLLLFHSSHALTWRWKGEKSLSMRNTWTTAISILNSRNCCYTTVSWTGLQRTLHMFTSSKIQFVQETITRCPYPASILQLNSPPSTKKYVDITRRNLSQHWMNRTRADNAERPMYFYAKGSAGAAATLKGRGSNFTAVTALLRQP